MQPSLWLATPRAAAHFDPARQSTSDRWRWSRATGARSSADWSASRALLAHVGPTAGTRSLSHAQGFAALALAPEGSRVGVDIEHLDPPRDCLRLARFAFAPVEAAQIEALEDSARPERFCALWTLKEACIKALGLSLLEGLRRCVFTVTDGEWQGELPASILWKAHLYRPRPTLYLAVVVAPGAHEWRQYEWPESAPPRWPLLAALNPGNAG